VRASRGRWRAAGLTTVLAAALVAAAAPAPAASQSAPDENPLESARTAARSYAFSGQVRLRWRDGSGEHEQLVDVRAGDGTMVVEGDASVLARRDERLIRRPGASWDALWPAGLASLGAPRPATKYTMASAQGTSLAGRPTTLVEVRRGDRVVERVWLDAATGLLLGREQYTLDGALARSIQFQNISVGGPTGDVPSPHVARPAVAVTTARQVPSILPGGYERLGTYKRGALVHFVYSDGVYGLSVFEQVGRLRAGTLPAGAERVRIGDTQGWHYAWAGGHVLLWRGHGRVYSAVGDGPLTDVVQASAGVPLGPTPSLLQRVRAACHGVLRALKD
jgi:hypothetical protein